MGVDDHVQISSPSFNILVPKKSVLCHDLQSSSAAEIVYAIDRTPRFRRLTGKRREFLLPRCICGAKHNVGRIGVYLSIHARIEKCHAESLRMDAWLSSMPKVQRPSLKLRLSPRLPDGHKASRSRPCARFRMPCLPHLRLHGNDETNKVIENHRGIRAATASYCIR